MQLLLYLAYRAAAFVVVCLPLVVVFRAGEFLGWLAWLSLVPYRKLVLANLRAAFAGEKSEAEIRRLARRHFQLLGANALSATKLSAMTDEAVLARMTFENDDLARTLIGKSGLVAAISHIGNWELFARVPARYGGARLGTVYQPLANRYIDAHLLGTRQRSGVATFPRNAGFLGPVNFLRNGGLLGVLIDQHAGDGGVWTPLFGRLASTSPLAATLAQRTGTPLLPVAIYTAGVARWRLVAEPPVPTTGDVGQITAELNQVLERQIARAPEDWFWVHARWKTPSPRFLLAGYKRGIAFPAGNRSAQPALKPFRILIRSSNWLGDAVMSIPAVEAIKAGRPDAHVTVLAPAKLAALWRKVACVDDVISTERASVFGVARTIAGRFDAAVLFPNSLRAALEVALAGVPRRVGYAGHHRRWLLHDVVKTPRPKEPAPPPHHAQRFLVIAKYIGANVDPAFLPQFPARPASPRNWRPLLALCAGAEYGPAKRWQPERFAKAARRISEGCAADWILVGTAGDARIAAQIAPRLGTLCTDLTGKTSLAELIDRLTACDLLLTNDTGTMHLAAFLGLPVVAVFGSTEPSLTGPLGERVRIVRHHVECSPCFLRECPLDFRCMLAVTPEEVADAVLELLANTNSQAIPPG